MNRTVIPTSSDVAYIDVNGHSDLKDWVIQHAEQRIQISYATFLAYWKKACRTDNPPLDVQFHVGPATHQIGQSKVRGKQAAHSNCHSGICSNWPKKATESIIEDKKVTPLKRKILKIRIDTPEIKKLEAATVSEPDKLYQLFLSAWGSDRLIGGTELELLTNGTNSFDSVINQFVDKPMEKALRYQVIPSLFEQCMKGKISPERATKKITKAIQSFFKKRIDALDTKIAKLKKYQRIAKQCFKFEQEVANPTEQQATIYLKNLDKLRELKLRDDLPTNHKFFHFLFDRSRRKKNISNLDQVKILWENYPSSGVDFSKFETEIKRKLNFTKKLKNYSQLELLGTRVPNFKQFTSRKRKQRSELGYELLSKRRKIN